MTLIRNAALGLALTVALIAALTASWPYPPKITAHAAPLQPNVVRQLERTTGTAVQRAGAAVGRMFAADVHRIPGVGPAITIKGR